MSDEELDKLTVRYSAGHNGLACAMEDLREAHHEIDRLRADKERLIADYNDQQRIIAEANNLATDLMLERDRLRAQLATAVDALERAADDYCGCISCPIKAKAGEALAHIKEGK